MMDNIKKNLHIFQKTYQKPSQIYKFLREHWKVHPLYLNRSLSYISKHRTRTVCKRDTKIDNIARQLLKQQSARQSQRNNSSCPSGCRYDTSNNNSNNNKANGKTPLEDKKVFFNWICDDLDRTSQKTRSCGHVCPWCEKDYHYLDSLMAHLKCCHPRFSFNLVEEDGQSVIVMTLNSSYDGSYQGFKYPGHNLRHDFKFTPKYPERRIPATHLFQFRAKKRQSIRSTASALLKLTNDSDNFTYDGDEADVDVCSGRLYYHTSTCLPVKPNEVDIDSEADIDPDWLRERTQLMIDEFTDVNEGEKEILKLWNLHIMKNYKYKGDNMIPQACLDFVESEGPTILSKCLYKNFALHLANLYDFGLLGSRDMLECIRMLKKLKPPVLNSPIRAASKIKLERNSNEHCQHSPPAKRALLNSLCNQ